MGFKNLLSFRAGKDKAPSVKEAAANKIAILEERVNGKAKKLAEAEQQIKNLSVPVPEAEEKVRPHGPLVELEVQPSTGEESAGENSEVEPLGVVTAEQKPAASAAAEVKTAPAPAAAAQPADATATQDDQSLSNLFSQEEDEENPLAALINSLPDVSVKELLNDLHEIKSIIKEMPHR